MNRATLDRLLSLGEGQDIEFKARPEARVIGPQVCAFLNSWGGYVVFGVADSGEVSGVPIGSDLVQLEQGIVSGLAPRAMVTFEEHDLDGKTVWVIAGTASPLATTLRAEAQSYTLHLYGRRREVVAVERLVILKTLRGPVRVVWVVRRTQWVALVTTDLTLSLAQIVEYSGARWKIEAGFREIKQEIGSAETQTRTPDAVTNHLNFCMVATAIT